MSNFSSIEQIQIAALTDSRRRFLQWIVPRQSGATSYLVDRGLKDCYQDGLDVVYIGPKFAMDQIRKMVVDKRSQLMRDEGGSITFIDILTRDGWFNKVKGLKLDRVYIDNWIYSTTEQERIKFINFLNPVLSRTNGLALALNTTEGY